MSGVNKGNVEFLKGVLNNLQIEQQKHVCSVGDVGWSYLEGYTDALKMVIFQLEDNDDY